MRVRYGMIKYGIARCVIGEKTEMRGPRSPLLESISLFSGPGKSRQRHIDLILKSANLPYPTGIEKLERYTLLGFTL